MFKPYTKRLSGYVFLTASNPGRCVGDLVSARVVVQTPPRADGGFPDVRILLGGEAKDISNYPQEAKP